MHYKNHCDIVSPHTGKIFHCRRCYDGHTLCPGQIKEIVCRRCNLQQDISNCCTRCNLPFAKYQCIKCPVFDDDGEYFHCDKCGICRKGTPDLWHHCDVCGMCVPKVALKEHTCIPDKANDTCSICCEPFFKDFRSVTEIPQCGHLIHSECFSELCKHNIKCPLCSKTMFDMTDAYEELNKVRMKGLEHLTKHDVHLSNQSIHCNDCNHQSECHPFNQRCKHCLSYNTRAV